MSVELTLMAVAKSVPTLLDLTCVAVVTDTLWITMEEHALVIMTK